MYNVVYNVVFNDEQYVDHSVEHCFRNTLWSTSFFSYNSHLWPSDRLTTCWCWMKHWSKQHKVNVLLIWCQLDVNLMRIWSCFKDLLMSFDLDLMHFWWPFDLVLMTIWCPFDAFLMLAIGGGPIPTICPHPTPVEVYTHLCDVVCRRRVPWISIQTGYWCCLKM